MTQQRCSSESKKETLSRLMFPPRLQALVELEMQRRLAKEYFAKATACVDVKSEGSLSTQTSSTLMSGKSERDSQKVETAEAQDDASTSLTEHENFDSLDKVEQLKNVLFDGPSSAGNHKLENGQAVHDITLFDPSLLEMASFIQ